jgi:hypothetical protein
MQSVPYRCPICGGCGKMPRDFYPDLRDTTGPVYVDCRSCWGLGLVYGATDEENLPSGGPWYNPNGIYPWTYIYPKTTYYWTLKSSELTNYSIPGIVHICNPDGVLGFNPDL